jgi:hypothetical protein
MDRSNSTTSKPVFFEAVYYDQKTRDAFEAFLASEYNLEPWYEKIKKFTSKIGTLSKK